MAMSKMFVAARARTFKRTVKQRRNRKVATIGSVKRMIMSRLDQVRGLDSLAGGAIVIAGTVYAVKGIQVVNTVLKHTMRFSITNVTNANNLVRIIFFQWGSETTPTTLDVLETAKVDEVYENSSNQPLSTKRLNILSDRTYSFNLFDKSERSFKINLHLKKIRPRTEALDGVNNKVYALFISNVDTNTTLGTMYFDYTTVAT